MLAIPRSTRGAATRSLAPTSADQAANRLPWLLAAVMLAALASLPANAAERLVVAGGDLTEIVYALGEGERVVGVDSTSTHPDAALELPSIGYVRSLAPESVLSLQPDRVLASHYAGPDTALERIRATGVDVEKAPELSGDAERDVPAKIRFVGSALERQAEAERLVGRFERELEAVTDQLADVTQRPRVLFVLSAGEGPLMIGGEDTAVADVIRRAGGEPMTAGIEGYGPLSPEAIMDLQPQAVLVMASQSGQDRLLDRPDFSETPAGKEGRLIAMDGMLLLGFGPRTPQAIRELGQALHPQRFASTPDRP
ncbi:heme/hemin ABC transporter substrate-binding protein [Billgrantia gudaonensis]|uniref:Iron complex transport system substrate-binding protein n=1 Tax=Billgrantia gudaonensis TaxID=376427 RepID=A0A1G8Q408_9GAMM|nr:ABC transporter substrate-binding protein [Halomonas gudaonensis]SDI99358.1 iron complex transport system substrate-binding protein [Halomonas gudaonensis]